MMPVRYDRVPGIELSCDWFGLLTSTYMLWPVYNKILYLGEGRCVRVRLRVGLSYATAVAARIIYYSRQEVFHIRGREFL